MTSSLESRLYQATARTFEQLGFLLPATDLTDEQRTARCDASVEVRFTGPLAGRLVLNVSRGVLPGVAGNMLGIEPEEVSESDSLDALGELANVICGNVLPEIAGDRAMFDLSRPAPPVTSPAAPPQTRVEVGLEAGRAEVAIYLEAGEAGLPESRAA